jgi:hypothetical protein
MEPCLRFTLTTWSCNSIKIATDASCSVNV